MMKWGVGVRLGSAIIPMPSFHFPLIPRSTPDLITVKNTGINPTRRKGLPIRTTIKSFCTTATSPSSSQEREKSVVGEDGETMSLWEKGNMLELRVGRIIKAWKHEEADSLYVEEVEVGEAETRIICSGLVKYVPLGNLLDRKVVVLANLKPRNMRGVKSCGMLVAASDDAHENVELLDPPEGSVPGDRVWFGDGSGSPDQPPELPPPASPNQIQKKKIWESVQPHLKTDDTCKAMLGEHFMQTSTGIVMCKSLKNANIS